MVDVNETLLVGSLASDPEIRNMGDGRSVCNLRVETKTSWKDRNTGEPKSRSTYHAVVIFNNELIAQAQRLKSGSRVTLRGELQNRKWQDAAGNDRWTTEVVIQGFDGKFIPHATTNGAVSQPRENIRSAPQRGHTPPQSGRNSVQTRQLQAAKWDEDVDDSIPFVD